MEAFQVVIASQKSKWYVLHGNSLKCQAESNSGAYSDALLVEETVLDEVFSIWLSFKLTAIIIGLHTVACTGVRVLE